MADQISQIIASGKNVIFPVGSAYVKGLESRLGSKSILLLTDNSKVSNEIIFSVPKNRHQIRPVAPLNIKKRTITNRLS